MKKTIWKDGKTPGSVELHYTEEYLEYMGERRLRRIRNVKIVFWFIVFVASTCKLLDILFPEPKEVIPSAPVKSKFPKGWDDRTFEYYKDSE